MRSTLPRSRSARRSLLTAIACLAGAMAFGASASDAPFAIRSAALTPSQGVWMLNAQLAVTLPDGARQAVVDGVALTVTVKFELQRARRFWLDDTVASLKQNYQIVYHALSQNFLLRNVNSGEQSAHSSLDAALEALCAVRDLPVIDRSLLSDQERYQARLRAALDVRTLPDTLRLVLFWTDDWRQDTDWFVWPLEK